MLLLHLSFLKSLYYVIELCVHIAGYSNMYIDGILNLYLKCNNQLQIAVEFTPFSRGWRDFFAGALTFPLSAPVFFYTIAIYLSIFCNYLHILISILDLLKLYGAGLGQEQRNNTTDFLYEVLRVVLETGVGIRDNPPKWGKIGLRQWLSISL